MRPDAASWVLAAGALALPLFWLPAAFDAFLLPKGALLVTIAVCAGGLRVWDESVAGLRSWSVREAAWAGVAAAAGLSWAAGPWKAAGVDAVALAVGWALTGLVAERALASRGAMERAARAAAVAAALVAAWSMREGHPVAASTPMGYYTHLSSLLVGSFPLALWVAWSAVGVRRLAWSVGAFVVAAATVAIGSRAAWLAACVSWPLAAALLRSTGPGGGRRTVMTLAGGLLAAAFLALVTPTGPFLAERARDALDPRSKAVAYRRLEWAVARDMFRERPWLGQGPGGYHFRYLEHQARVLSLPEIQGMPEAWNSASSAHNAVLHIAAEQGLLGLAALAALALTLVAGWRRRRHEPEAELRACWAAAALAIAVDSLLNVTIQLPASLYLLALAGAGAGGAPAESDRRWPLPGPARWVAVAAVAPALAGLLLLIWWRTQAELAVGQAWRLAAGGAPVEAERFIDRAVDLAPWYGRAHFFQGNVRLLLGNPAGAEASLRRSLRLQMDPNAVYDIALAALQRGDLPAARKSCVEALRFKPRFPEALATLGDLERREGRLEEARVFFERSLEAAGLGEEAGARYLAARELGILESRAGRFARAVELLGPVVHAFPDDVEAAEALRRSAAKAASSRGGTR
jgi:O-antigen ligase/Tfp pilus assembly protein PilF